MKTTFILTSIFFALTFSAPNAFSLRCGSKLVEAGDYKYEVLLACGPPVSREVIGYIDQEKRGDRIRVMKIEEWIIKVSNSYYRLVFEGNVMTEEDRVARN